MSIQRHVWMQGDADVKVYAENVSGGIVDFITGETPPFGEEPDPIFTYCYWEGVRISSSTTVTRRAVTGRGRRKIVTPAGVFDDVSVDVDHMFFRKAVEFDLQNVFNPHTRLRLALQFTDIAYNDIAPLENDLIQASFAKAQNFSINARDNEVVDASAHFEAELIL